MKTERLTLRELAEGDERFILELLNEPDFLRNIGDRGVRDEAAAARYIADGPRASYARNGFGLYCVTRNDEPIGICGLLKRDTLADVDIGFAFLERFRGDGYALEAATAVMGQAIDRGLPRVVAITVDDNASSIRLLEKLGMQFERVVKLGDDPTPLKLFSIDL
jgi:[ribosomal protein S5]-alanine N-acetyltransferase